MVVLEKALVIASRVLEKSKNLIIVMPLDEDFATALQLPLCSDDEVLSML